MKLAVQPYDDRRAGQATTARAAMTPITRDATTATFVAPWRRHDGATRGECWGATSTDGLWRYERLDDVTSPWRVTYTPSGQRVEDMFGTLARARRATADPAALLELRRAAFTAALGPAPTIEGARWLAGHLRVAGADQADARCRCGGMLAEVTAGGRLAHLDACGECTTIGEAGIVACERPHHFCATPHRA